MSEPQTAIPSPAPEDLYSSDAVERRVVRDAADGTREVFLVLGGIRCGACAALIEERLGALPGIAAVEINFANHRARVAWDPARLRLADLVGTVRALGYEARPYDPARLDEGLEAERRDRLRRLGIAGLLGMQVMMIAFALYAGEGGDMEARWRDLLRWTSLVLATPIVAWCAAPFLEGALRDLGNRRAGMDVPVSLGIAIAYAGSAHATVTGAGAVYFDSVAMFVFLLLLARYLEFAARARHARAAESLVTPTPALARRIDPAGAETVVAAAELAPGERVRVRAGEAVPADGRVVAGRSSVDEALLTGESRPVPKSAGDGVVAGSVNQASPIELVVERTGDDTVLAQVLALVERARVQKPRAAVLADRVAARFVAAVLVLAAGVALYWWQAAPDTWLSATVAVLVVTCPCALSLATPAAFTAAVGALARHGLIVTRPHAVEALARIDRFAFDKTGTLTRGSFSVTAVRSLAGVDEARLARIAAALEQHSEHPLGRAIEALARGPLPIATEVESTPGGGLEGTIEGTRYLLGDARFVREKSGLPVPESDDGEASVVWLARPRQVLGAFELRDAPRPGAGALLEALGRQGVRTALLSGDRPGAAREVARALGIEEWAAALRPEDKLERIRRFQAGGEVVAMAGDGINDAPVLAAADVSVAMGTGPDAARASADLILLGDDLLALAGAIRIARRCRRIVAQNLSWAVLYNVVALPAAAAGLVAPWMAALGMSLSSLAVVANGLRAGRG